MFEHLFARQDGLDALRTAVAAVSLISALVYLPFVATAPSPLRTAIKTFAIGVLALLPLTYVGGGPDIALVLLAIALALSALGDFFLALERQERFFLPGLVSFLAAHVAYLLLFVPRAAIPHGWTLVAAACVLAAAGALIAWLAPSLGRLRGPVFAYFAIIMAMVAAALSMREAPWLVGAGAVSFAISDSLIAVRKFKRPLPYIDIAIWVTYCAAQFMIASGLLAVLVPAGIAT